MVILETIAPVHAVTPAAQTAAVLPAAAPAAV